MNKEYQSELHLTANQKFSYQNHLWNDFLIILMATMFILQCSAPFARFQDLKSIWGYFNSIQGLFFCCFTFQTWIIICLEIFSCCNWLKIQFDPEHMHSSTKSGSEVRNSFYISLSVSIPAKPLATEACLILK